MAGNADLRYTAGTRLTSFSRDTYRLISMEIKNLLALPLAGVITAVSIVGSRDSVYEQPHTHSEGVPQTPAAVLRVDVQRLGANIAMLDASTVITFDPEK